jgi:dsRNA-specific ribonuclease
MNSDIFTIHLSHLAFVIFTQSKSRRNLLSDTFGARVAALCTRISRDSSTQAFLSSLFKNQKSEVQDRAHSSGNQRDPF